MLFFTLRLHQILENLERLRFFFWVTIFNLKMFAAGTLIILGEKSITQRILLKSNFSFGQKVQSLLLVILWMTTLKLFKKSILHTIRVKADSEDDLLCGEKTGTKLDKARTLGVKIITEQKFLKMLPQ